MKQNYFKKTFGDFFRSFTMLKDKFLLSWIYDAVFYAIIVLILTQILSLIKNQLLAILPLAMQSASSPDAAIGAAAAITTFLRTYTVLVVLIPLLVLAVYSLFKGVIWNGVAGEKFGINWKLGRKFFLTNLVWFAVSIPVFIFWPGLLALVSVMYNAKWLSLIIVFVSALLYIHLLTTAHYSFAKTQNLGKALGSIFTLGFAKIRMFILPYLLATVVFYVWWQLWRIVGGITTISEVRFILFTAIIFAPFFAWLRLYMAERLKEAA